MTFNTVDIDPAGVEQLASTDGFFDSDEVKLQSSMLTTLFVSSPSEHSQGRCWYQLDPDGRRQWMPNSLRCFLVDASIATQTYSSPSFDAVDKLLLKVTSIAGEVFSIRCGLDSWTSSSFLTCINNMSRKELAETIEISLKAKGRAVFASISCIAPDGSFTRVQIPREQLGVKLDYQQCCDAISWANNTAQDNEDSAHVEETVAVAKAEDDEAFAPSEADLDQVLESIRQPAKRRNKSRKSQAEATSV